MIRVEVAERHIRAGCRADIDNCPVARALEEATDEPCAVFSDGESCRVFLEVGGMVIVAPEKVQDFVDSFDSFNDSISEVEELPFGLSPFEFEIPDLGGSEWKEQCCECQELFSPDELDEYGFCDQCAEEIEDDE